MGKMFVITGTLLTLGLAIGFLTYRDNPNSQNTGFGPIIFTNNKLGHYAELICKPEMNGVEYCTAFVIDEQNSPGRDIDWLLENIRDHAKRQTPFQTFRAET